MLLRCNRCFHPGRAIWSDQVHPVGNNHHGHWNYSLCELVLSAPDLCWKGGPWVCNPSLSSIQLSGNSNRSNYSLGNGINTVSAPLLQAETANSRWRGRLVMLEMLMNIGGFMVVNWINYGLAFAGGAISWRLPIALQFVFILVLFGTVPWLPESPR